MLHSAGKPNLSVASRRRKDLEYFPSRSERSALRLGLGVGVGVRVGAGFGVWGRG